MEYNGEQYCTIVTLDIKNPFNSATWLKIRQAMFKFGLLGYLRIILDDYLHNIIHLYDMDEEVQRYAVQKWLRNNGLKLAMLKQYVLKWTAM